MKLVGSMVGSLALISLVACSDSPPSSATGHADSGPLPVAATTTSSTEPFVDDSADYWSRENCGLESFARLTAIVTASPVERGGNHEYAFSIDLAITDITWQRASAGLAVTVEGAPIAVSVYADLEADYRRSIAGRFWPVIEDAAPRLIGLMADPLDATRLTLSSLDLSDPDEVRDVLRLCEFDQHFADLGERLGRPGDLSLLIDFATEIELYEACFAAATEECPVAISLAADLASHEMPPTGAP
ncbi:MAG: hypothetical protein ABMA25_17275 [Ilumatobacteraceae bacterium]